MSIHLGSTKCNNCGRYRTNMKRHLVKCIGEGLNNVRNSEKRKVIHQVEKIIVGAHKSPSRCRSCKAIKTVMYNQYMEKEVWCKCGLKSRRACGLS